MAVTLSHIEYAADGAETEPPLVIAHGLFGQARNFHSIAGKLTRNRRVISVDMRNHGDAPHDAEMDYPAMAEDLADAVDRLAGGQAVVLGHSMGGKAAMGLALSAPERVAGLIVADIAPVPYTHSHLGFVHAMQGVDLAQVSRRSEADQQLRAGVPDPMLRAFLLQSLIVKPGDIRWRLNLEALDQNMDALIDWPAVWPETRFAGPALFLTGGASDYVTAEMHTRVEALFPAAEFEAIAGAAHWLHADKPDAFTASVAGWLERH